MNRLRSLLILSLPCLLFVFLFTACDTVADPEGQETEEAPHVSGAGKAMDAWFNARAYPSGKLDMAAYSKGYESYQESKFATHKTMVNEWEPMGPHNIGGRTLCLAFNPQNPNTIWAGSAAGGVWKSNTGGVGVSAWEYVPTGFPVLGVAAMAFHPTDSNILYIGTGEVYNYRETGDRVAVRTTRGSYGIGILKTTDGGVTWSKSLDWAYDELKGVQDIQVDEFDPATVWAATSEGTYKSTDAGGTWNLVHNSLMATEVFLFPGRPDTIFLSTGNLNTPNGGIFRSYDGGANFTQLTNGLPASFTGKILLDATSPPAPFELYASVADSLAGIGLYKSVNMGNTWSLVNGTDFQKWQGWYSHDVAVNPSNPSNILTVGIDVWVSFNGGAVSTQVSDWRSWYIYSTPPIGGPGGGTDWVHGDIHHAYWHPTNSSIAYFATDGGIFRTVNTASTFEDVNGGYQTTQFYANFANSRQDSNIAIGGLQDNGTAIYQGSKAWYRVIGGDGVSCAVDQSNDQNLFAGYQYGNILLSNDGGLNWYTMLQGSSQNPVNFVAPYEISETDASFLYAGEDVILKSTNAGGSWLTMNNGLPLAGPPILKIEIDPNDRNHLYASTTPYGSTRGKLFRSTNAGFSFTEVTGILPDRYYMDIEIHPVDPTVAYVVLQGFGTDHVYKTINGGGSWAPTGNGLPDVPTNSIVIDPLAPEILYVGNDLGVYASTNSGNSWTAFGTDLPDAVMALDLSISHSNRKLRVATHGSGVFEADLFNPSVSIDPLVESGLEMRVGPNPMSERGVIEIDFPQQGRGEVQLLNVQGQVVRTLIPNRNFAKGILKQDFEVGGLASGMYWLRLNFEGQNKIVRLLIE